MITQLLRVVSVRSPNRGGRGGCIFSGKAIDVQGSATDAKAYLVVRAAPLVVAGVEVQPGQWWTVAGKLTERPIEVNGFRIVEQQIEASSATLERPSGEHLVAFMAENPAFVGIGSVKARKLWDGYGDGVYEVLDRGAVADLEPILGIRSARAVVEAWSLYGNSRNIQWLQELGLPVSLGRKLIEFFKNDVADRISEDPYRLLSFCATWNQVDALAKNHFDIAEDDPRRLQGAVEEACYRIFSDGHTTVLSKVLMRRLQQVLGAQTKTFQWRQLVNVALSEGFTNGSYIVGHHGIRPFGPMVMERTVAKAIATRLKSATPAISSKENVDRVLNAFEDREDIELNDEQRAAVYAAGSNAFACIVGAAGVGKTTVLKALYEVYGSVGIPVVQIALAGRAAKRMQEATDRPASTIASWLKDAHTKDLSGPMVIVVDEASMVDVIGMCQICNVLPDHARMVLVGDPAQLMPVGPGLILHKLAGLPGVPTVELKVVKRHGNAIAEAANSIRNGRWPELYSDRKSPISFTQCAESDIAQTVVDLYLEAPNSTQVLSSRRSGPDGTHCLNAALQFASTSGAQPLLVWNEGQDRSEATGISLGDTVLCTRNLWNHGITNGSIGKLVEILDQPTPGSGDECAPDDYTLGWIEWDDGVCRALKESMLDDIILGYSITTHKAQGSQWHRIIVPVTANRNLDRTMLYTAVTRAQQQVILVGDFEAAKLAAISPPRAQSREVCLDLDLREMMGQTALAGGNGPEYRPTTIIAGGAHGLNE